MPQIVVVVTRIGFGSGASVKVPATGWNAGPPGLRAAMIDAAPMPMWFRGPDARLKLVNRAYVQAVGVELAPHHVQVNAIAQNFVDNPTYFPPEVQANPRFQERLAREVPLGRLVSAREDAMFAAYLCSPAADCFVGQVFPICGGWVAR